MATAPNTFGKRLKEARELAGLSQRRLGIEAGLDEFVASTRVNRYERGVHEVDTVTAGQLAKALRVPRAYLYADEDAVARMILLFSRVSRERQRQLLKELEQAAGL